MTKRGGAEPWTLDPINVAILYALPYSTIPGETDVAEWRERLAEAWDEGWRVGRKGSIQSALDGDFGNPYRQGGDR